MNGARGVVEGVRGRRVAVRFAAAGDRLEVLEPAEWRVVDDRGAPVAVRAQIPLRLAWALSIHKCQGMEIDAVDVATRGIFEYGQLYVALSRVTTLDGLFLTDWDPARLRAHPAVVAYYDALPPPPADAEDVVEGIPTD